MSGSRRGGGCLAGLAFVTAILLGILFVGSTLVVLLMFNVEQKFLQPGLYKDVMVQQNIYVRVPELAAEQIVYSSTRIPTGEENEGETASDQALIVRIIALASPALSSCLQTELGPIAYADLGAASRSPTATEAEDVKACLRANGVPAEIADTHSGMPIFFWMLSERDWRNTLEVLLPPDWLRAQFESVIDQIYADLSSNQNQAAIKIPMTDLKARLQGDEGFDAIVALLEAQPVCTPDQLAQIQGLADPYQPLKDVPVCRPPDAAIIAIYPNIRATLAFLAEQIPNEAELKYATDPGSSSQDPLEQPRQVLSAMRTIVRASFLVPIVLLALVVAFGARSKKGLLRCLGIPLLVGGALGVLIVVAGLASTHQLVSNMLLGAQSSGSTMAPGIRGAAVDLMGAIAEGYLGAFLVQATAMAVVGLVMVIGSFFVDRPRPIPAPG